MMQSCRSLRLDYDDADDVVSDVSDRSTAGAIRCHSHLQSLIHHLDDDDDDSRLINVRRVSASA